MIGRIAAFWDSRRRLACDRASVESLQASRLRATVQHAYHHVPYYRRLFDQAGVSPDQITTVADLKQIPISRKEDLLAAGNDHLLADNVDRSRLVSVSTSGTTGQPFTIYQTREELRRRRFLDLRALIADGFGPLDKLATFTVRPPGDAGRAQRLLYRNQYFSTLKPAPETIAELRAFAPTLLWTYPSSFLMLIDHTEGDLQRACRPRMLVTTAETVEPAFLDTCRRHGLEHFNYYGAVEVGRIAWECPAHAGLHVNIDNVILEIEPFPGVPEPGLAHYGEAVVTTLDNRSMPFIRYRLGDLCHYLDKPCSCGVELPLLSAPIGRSSALIRLPSGKLMSPRFLAPVLMQDRRVRQFRMTQLKPDQFVVELVLAPGADRSSLLPLHAGLLEALPESVTIEMRQVPSITPIGPKPQTFIPLVN